MGREWYWGGRSSRRSSCSEGDDHRDNPSLAGCMGAVLHFFAFHPSHLSPHFVFNKQQRQQQPTFMPTSFLPDDPPSPKGVEAPRNSLEVDEASLSYLRREESLHIPLGLQIKTTRNGGIRSKAREQGLQNNHFASESPSAKTPNLLARLMGLDILPQTSSPSSSSHHLRPDQLQLHHVRPKRGADYSVSGTRSLPESPRMSSARRSDVDRHSRLSLQINFNKENSGVSEGIEHGKERTRRKVGLIDITNTNRNLELGEEVVSRRNKAENSTNRLKKMVDDSSPRPRFLDPVSENLSTTLSTKCTKEKNHHLSKAKNAVLLHTNEVISEKPNLKPKPQSFQEHQQTQIRRRFCSKPQQEEAAFICPSSATKAINNKTEKSSKETPLSNDHLNLNPPTFFPVKKDPSPPPTKIPHEQPCNYPKGKQKHPTREGAERNSVACTTTIDGGAAEFQYVRRILSSSGISMHAPVTFPRQFSPSNPLDPSVFHYLENTVAAAGVVDEPICHRSNRKLLFHLVDELLAEILKTQMDKKPCENSTMQGWQLAEKLCEKIGEFPRANCQVLEDIDALIDKDLPKSNFQMSTTAETEGIVKVVELEILDSLLRETAAIAFMGSCGYGVV